MMRRNTDKQGVAKYWQQYKALLSFILLSSVGLLVVFVVLLSFVLFFGEVPHSAEYAEWPVIWGITLILVLGGALLKSRKSR